MGILSVLFFRFLFAASQITVDIIYSSFTDLDFVTNLATLVKHNFQDEFEFNLVPFGSLWDENYFFYSPDIIFDLTFSTSLSESIKKIAEEKKIIIASINSSTDVHDDREFFIHNSWKSQIEALYGIISFLNWQTFIVISDEISNENREVFSYYFSDKNFRWFLFPNSNNENAVDLFIGKVIQPIGIRNIVILNKGENTKLLLKILERKNLLNNGTGIVVGSEGSWGLYGNGVISYTESGLESADSYYSYEGLAFTKFLRLILSLDLSAEPFSLFQALSRYYRLEVENLSEIKNSVASRTNKKGDLLIKNLFANDNHPISNFTLLNIKNCQKNISGNILKGNLTIREPLNYPGDSSIMPNSPVTYINIWYDNQFVFSVGILYALNYWKSIHSLDGFEITTTQLVCTGAEYDENFALACFSRALTTPAVGF